MLSYLCPHSLKTTLPVFGLGCEEFYDQEWTTDEVRILPAIQTLFIQDGVLYHKCRDFDKNDESIRPFPQIPHPVAIYDEAEFHEEGPPTDMDRVFCRDGEQWLVVWGTKSCPNPMVWKIDPCAHVECGYGNIPSFRDLLKTS
jgi:hypothetical protein